MKILGSEKFENFDGFEACGEKKSFLFTFKDESTFTCSSEHAIKLENEWCLAREINVGDFLSGKEIVSIFPLGYKETFSPMNVGSDFSYYSEGIINHNCAFLGNWEEFFSAVYPTISSGTTTKMLLTSTPNGMNHYYDICTLAALKNSNPEKWNGFEYIEVKWDRVPGRDEKWKEDTLASMNFNQEQFDQEFNCLFQGSSNNLLSSAVLGKLVHETPLRSSDDGIKQYVEPQLGNDYVLVSDVSRGKGLDYSAFSIFNVSKAPYEQVCAMRNNRISPIDYATMLVKVGTIYNTAAVLIEINDIGAQVSDVMHFEYGYENLLFTESKNGRRRIAGGFSGSAVDKGIRTTSSVKRLGCSVMKMLFDQNKILIRDEETIKELKNFVIAGDSYGAAPGFHDDLAMTLVLFSWLTSDVFFKDMSPVDTFEMLKNRTDEDWESELMPFGFIMDGNDNHAQDEYLFRPK